MKQRQIGWVFIAIVLVVALLPFFQYPGATLPFIYLVLFLVILNFYQLTIVVDNESVHFSLGIGLIGKRFLFQDIESCKAINYLPMGYGIRLRLSTTIYNVAGRKAVELCIKGKKRKIWIGTNKPEEIVKHINDTLDKRYKRKRRE